MPTSFEVEVHAWVVFVGQFDYILHNDYINGFENIRFYSKNTIYSSKQTFIVRIFVVLNEIIKHVEEHFLLRASHRLDQQFVVLGEEEERAALSRSLACFEHILDVVLYV